MRAPNGHFQRKSKYENSCDDGNEKFAKKLKNFFKSAEADTKETETETGFRGASKRNNMIQVNDSPALSTTESEGNDKIFDIFLPDHRTWKESDDVCKLYDQWAVSYNQDCSAAKYRGSEIVARYVDKYVRDKSSVLVDMCGGTGLGAEKVREYGFTTIDYLDGSTGMARIAKSKNLYNTYYQDYLLSHKQTSLKSETYDCVFCIGSFLPGHLKPEVCIEFARVLKKGMITLENNCLNFASLLN
ncbi:unnamed protein product [Soboliphyme baturini]|uniref:Methyltransf_11 domain-containing protein n=1 Tax=Soboliphyme baturini TaxID=241478 RepID=A0A183ITF1_9BILA|nr:unnamed protein product [Soboliphyme baturini]